VTYTHADPTEAPAPPDGDPIATTAPDPAIAVLGLGYVGLPTSLLLHEAGRSVIGVDIADARRNAIRAADVDLLEEDFRRLDDALHGGEDRFEIVGEPARIADADSVLICVPTPVDEERRPETSALEGACRTAVEHARPGQLIVLTSTSHVGATRQLLIEPLARRGLVAGRDISVAFSPERIDPGNEVHPQELVPRVIGGADERCARRAAELLSEVASELHLVSSPEAAELTKLYENTFRAVNIALANEIEGLCRGHGLDPIEVTEAAATKPYGFLPFYPGPGVGGHCIPCDPYYLIDSPARDSLAAAPLVETAMEQIELRPSRMVERAEIALAERGRTFTDSRVLVVGLTYKPGVRDHRESPGIRIVRELSALGANVSFHDPLLERIEIGDAEMTSVAAPQAADYDLVLISTADPGADHDWIDDDTPVIDCTHRVLAGMPA